MTKETSWTIGAADDCDLRVEDPFVSGRHCRLHKADVGFVIEDLGSRNGTFVRGERITRPIRIRPGEAVTLGRDCRMPWPPEVAGEIGQVLSIGSDPDNDIVLDYPTVSGHHASLFIRADGLVIEDLGSRNGTAVGARSRRVKKVTVQPDDIVFFGTLRVPIQQLLRAEDRRPNQRTFRPSVSNPSILGRDPSCDRVLNDLSVSRRHASLRPSGERWIVEDLGSSNGTFVNGRRIDAPTTIGVGDVVTIGAFHFKMTDGDRLIELNERGNVIVEIRGVGVDVPDRRLLDDVSLTILPTEFVGLMGPSGAGKSTLLNVMNGYSRPSDGFVLFNGRDLYAHYAEFAGILGYVPQDDIIHRELTVRQALYYTARLRLPSDCSENDVTERIDRVMEQLGLQPAADVLIGSPERKGISGGQRKRVNLAMELLTDPAVLLLDEPTSGLSSEDTLMVMKLLRQLADAGKVILLTIHQPSLEAYRLMDHLVLIGKDHGSSEPGRLVFFGPAFPDAVEFFRVALDGDDAQAMSPDLVLRGLSRRPTAEWESQYQSSTHADQFIRQRTSREKPKLQQSGRARRSGIGGWRQWWTLARRNLTIKQKDRANTAILLAQSPIVATLIVMVFGQDLGKEVTYEHWDGLCRGSAMVLFLSSLSALWFGCSNSAREIVGEWAIYQRERMVGLRISSYLGSKLMVLSVLCAAQCGMLTAILRWGCELKTHGLTIFLMLVLTALVGVGIGLLISALARTSEVAIALLPIVLIPMVVLGGAVQPLDKMHVLVRGVAQLAPSRWAFEEMLLTEAALQKRMPMPNANMSMRGRRTETKEPPDIAEGFIPENRRWHRATPIICLVSMLGSFIAATAAVLRARDIH